MDSTDSFIEVLESLCARRKMYICGGSFYEVCAYLTGYVDASSTCPLKGDGWSMFSRFVCRHFGFPEKYVWPYVLNTCSKDDDEATEHLRKMLVDFLNRARSQSHQEILDSVLPPAVNEDAEPEKTLRRFLDALLTGRRDRIEPLIQDHANADVLWAGAYPIEVAEQLQQISESYPLRRVAEHSADDQVKLITAEFPFPITVRKVRSQWVIDADQIITLWQRQREDH